MAVGRWPLCATLVAGGLLMCSPQAHAAHWEMTFKPSGSNTPVDNNPSFPDNDWFDQGMWDYENALIPGFNPPGRFSTFDGQMEFFLNPPIGDLQLANGPSNVIPAASASSSGSVTVYLTWVQDAGDDPNNPVPAPSKVALRFWGGVRSSAQGSYNSGTVKAKFAGKTGTEDSVPFHYDYGSGYEKWSEVLGSKTIIIPVSQGTTEVQHRISLSGSASMPQVSDPPSTLVQESYVSVGMRVQAEWKNRGVGISSNIEPSFRKSTSQPFTPPAQTPLPAILGSVPPVWKEPVPLGEEVHSAAFWQEAGDVGWRGVGTYTANEFGMTNPTRQWSLSGGTKGIGSFFDAPNGPLSISEVIELSGQLDGNGMTKSSTISVNSNDGNGTAETNDYSINWHLPYENWFKYAPDVQSWVRPSLEIDEPGYARNNEAIGFKWNYEKAALADDTADGVGAGAAIAGALSSNPYIIGLWAIVGVAASELGKSEPDQTSANFDSCWSDDRSTFDQSPSIHLPFDEMQDEFKMVPVKLIGYTTVHAKADLYDTHGFAGTGHKNVRKYDNRSASIGHFINIVVGDGNGQS